MRIVIKPYIKNETAVDIICGICDKTRPDCDPADCKWMKMLAEEAVDAAEVVRCKDCRFFQSGENEAESWQYCSLTGINIGKDDYCSFWKERWDLEK